jgi:hypothetical protein
MNNMANYEWTQMEERLTTLNLYPNPVLAPTKAGSERVKTRDRKCSGCLPFFGLADAILTSRQEQPSETKQTTEERPLDCFACSSKLSGARVIFKRKVVQNLCALRDSELHLITI